MPKEWPRYRGYLLVENLMLHIYAPHLPEVDMKRQALDVGEGKMTDLRADEWTEIEDALPVCRECGEELHRNDVNRSCERCAGQQDGIETPPRDAEFDDDDDE